MTLGQGWPLVDRDEGGGLTLVLVVDWDRLIMLLLSCSLLLFQHLLTLPTAEFLKSVEADLLIRPFQFVSGVFYLRDCWCLC